MNRPLAATTASTGPRIRRDLGDSGQGRALRGARPAKGWSAPIADAEYRLADAEYRLDVTKAWASSMSRASAASGDSCARSDGPGDRRRDAGRTGRRGPTRITCCAAKGRVSVPQARAEHVTFASGARCSALASLVGPGASGRLRRSVLGAPRGSLRF